MRLAGHALDLSAKFAPPEPVGLPRGRLFTLAARRVGVVLAPAGYGKTTLLGQAAAAFAGAVAWYRLDAADRRRAALIAGVRRALTRAAPVDDALDSLDDVAVALGALGESRPMLLVLDDYHEIAGAESEQDLARFIATAPSGLHILLGGRRADGLEVAVARISGDVTVFTADDLRFRSWEVERLFRDLYREPLSPEDAAALTRRTEGWAAGLAMFHLITAGRAPAMRHQAVHELSRGSRTVRSYLVREVLGELPPKLRDFLRRTSALGVLTGSLCNELLEVTDSQAVLEELERRHLFTTTEDDGRQFRYHQVLLDHLEMELTESLGREATRRWYTRAAQLLLSAGEVRAAFRAFARAEDWAAVERLLHGHGAEVVARPLGGVEALLPPELSSHDPWLLLATARRLTSHGSLAEAVAAFHQAAAAAEDATLAGLCTVEARAVALWLPGADPGVRGWQSAVRAATLRSPRTVLPAALALPGAEGRLAAGAVAVIAGDADAADDQLRQAATHPDAGLRVLILAGLVRRLLQMLTRTPDQSGAVDLEALALHAEVAGWPWLARIGRALLEADDGAGSAMDQMAADATSDGDHWGAALIRLVTGLARRDAAMLDEAGGHFDTVTAPVLTSWCRALAAAAEPAGRDRAVLTSTQASGLREAMTVIRTWADGEVDERPACLDVTLFGAFGISVNGTPIDVAAVRPKARSALRMLAMHAGGVVHRDVVAGRLWPDADPDAALRSLQVAVSSVRSMLEGQAGRGRAAVVKRVGESYGLAMPPGSRCDLLDFESRLAGARAARRRGDSAAERQSLEHALALYSGDLLPEEGTAEWVTGERDRLRLAAATAAEDLARCFDAATDRPASIEAVRRCLQLDPYRDSGWRLLIALQETSGERAAAQATRLRHERVLAELGLPVPTGHVAVRLTGREINPRPAAMADEPARRA